MDKRTLAILVTVAFSAIGVVGDYFLKLASNREQPLRTGWFYLGFALYASTAFGWVFVMRHLKLATISVVYSVSMVLLLTALGVVVFRESLNAYEWAGLACAVASLVLLMRSRDAVKRSPSLEGTGPTEHGRSGDRVHGGSLRAFREGFATPQRFAPSSRQRSPPGQPIASCLNARSRQRLLPEGTELAPTMQATWRGRSSNSRMKPCEDYVVVDALPNWLLRTLETSIPAIAATTAAVAACGLAEGHAVAPVNAISHIAWGDEAAQQDDASWEYTGVGVAFEHGAVASWAAVYELAFGRAARGHWAAAFAGGAAISAWRTSPTTTCAQATDAGLRKTPVAALDVRRLRQARREPAAGLVLGCDIAAPMIAAAQGGISRRRDLERPTAISPDQICGVAGRRVNPQKIGPIFCVDFGPRPVLQRRSTRSAAPP